VTAYHAKEQTLRTVQHFVEAEPFEMPHGTERATFILRDRSLKTACDFAVASLHWSFGSGDALADYQ
jgi:hypothetical protein